MQRFFQALVLSTWLIAACNATSDAGFPDTAGGSAAKPVGGTGPGTGGTAPTGGSTSGGVSAGGGLITGGSVSAIGGTSPTTGGTTATGSSGNAGQSGSTGGRSNPGPSGGSSGTTTSTGGTAGTPNTGAGGEDTGSDAGAAGGPPGSPPTLTSFRLAVVGSSTSAGEGASSSSKGWVGLLESALEDSVTTSFTCDNLSVGGYTSEQLMPGSNDDGSIDDAIEREPDLIVVALAGSNDLSSGTSKATFLGRLEAMREAGKNAGIPVFFLTTAPKDLSNDEQEALKDWAEAIKDDFGSCWTPSSSDHSPCVIDVFDALANQSLGVRSEFSAGDGIHLNDAGHAELFRLARAIIEPYVCSLTSCQ